MSGGIDRPSDKSARAEATQAIRRLIVRASTQAVFEHVKVGQGRGAVRGRVGMRRRVPMQDQFLTGFAERRFVIEPAKGSTTATKACRGDR